MDAGKARSRSRLRKSALEPLTHFARGSSEAWQNEGSSRKRVDAAILGVRRWFGPARELYVRVGWGLLPVCTFARAASGHPQALGPAQEPVLRGAIWPQGTPGGLSLFVG